MKLTQKNLLIAFGRGRLYLRGNGPWICISKNLKINLNKTLSNYAIYLPEDMPPAHVVQEVVLPPGLELLVMCECVVEPPDTRGHVVG